MRASNVYLSFRYFVSDPSLALTLTRHVPVELANTIVDLMRATFVVSDEKQLTVRAELWIENAKGEQYLELTLPKDNVIRALAVNNISVSPLQKKGGGTLVKLASGSAPFPVQIIYSLPLGKNEKMGMFGVFEVKALEVPPEVPLNKIEADLYVPDDCAYMNFGGTLHARSGGEIVSNTLAWIDGLARGQKEAVVVDRGDTSKFPPMPPLMGNFPTQGRLFRFQTLAPSGTITLTYCDRKVFWLFDILVFLATGLGAWFLIRRFKLSPLWVCLAVVLVPLCAEWFSTSDFGELCAAMLCAGILIATAFVAMRAKQTWQGLREARLATAPDPFLEDGPATAPAH